MYIVKISELVNIPVPSMTVCAMLLPICIIRRFKDPHIQASRLKSWMFCYTGHLDLRLLFNFLPYLPYFMTTYAFGYWRHRLTQFVVVHNLVELCEARNDRDADLCLQEALKFQLHRCHIHLRPKNHFRRMNSALNYPNSHLSLEPP